VALAQDPYVSLYCHDNCKSYCSSPVTGVSPKICSQHRSHSWHGRPTLSNDADNPANRLADVSSTVHRNLVSPYRIAQIITWNTHWPSITCQLRRIAFFNVRNRILHSLWYSEWTATPEHKSTHCLFSVCNWNAACLLQVRNSCFKNCSNEYPNWKD
jgi:hypothetical protein